MILTLPVLGRYFFVGDGETETFAAGLAPIVGKPVGLLVAAGEALGAATGLVEAGGGVTGELLSRTTEFVPTPGSENSRARNIKMTAETTVAFSSGF